MDCQVLPWVRNTDIKVFILFKEIVILNGQFNCLLSFTGAKSQSASNTRVIIRGACSAIFSLVVNLNGKVEVTALTDNGDVERSNVLHDGVVRGIEKDPKKNKQ